MPTLEGGLAAIVIKYGWVKLATLGAALVGAAMMAAFRPPKTRKEMGLQALVALGCSFLFGDTIAVAANNYTHLFNLDVWTNASIQYYVAVHGFIGAFSWGLFGGIAAFRDRFAKDPVQAIKDARDI